MHGKSYRFWACGFNPSKTQYFFIIIGLLLLTPFRRDGILWVLPLNLSLSISDYWFTPLEGVQFGLSV
jgi:hypothetical protein